MQIASRTESSKEYRYGFNGKEKDEDGEFGSLTHYDYGFRIYNPWISRFLSVDPLAKQYPMLTPYQFASNTPIMAVDLDGLEYADSKGSVGPVSKDYLSNPDDIIHETYDVNNNNEIDVYMPPIIITANRLGDSSNIPAEETINNTIEQNKDAQVNTDALGSGLNLTSLAMTYMDINSFAASGHIGLEWAGKYVAKNGQIVDISLHPNQYLGPRATWKPYDVKFKSNIQYNPSYKLAGKIGAGFTVLSVSNTIYQYKTGQATGTQTILDIGVTGVTYRYPNMYTFAFGIGWELGRVITNTSTFQKRYHYDKWLENQPLQSKK